jgi:16S rRNA G966 N2-methylase RsmD
VEEACLFIRSDALNWLRKPVRQRFDLVFADPPYDLDEIPALPGLVRPHLAENGMFVLEHDTRQEFDSETSLVMSRAYGRTVISMFTP